MWKICFCFKARNRNSDEEAVKSSSSSSSKRGIGKDTTGVASSAGRHDGEAAVDAGGSATSAVAMVGAAHYTSEVGGSGCGSSHGGGGDGGG
ncbi:hypothetical protein CDL12_11946 [Handroanthus impetiginosus]|uniref:Uncharacterized protein n=1 Tax=Handroanthus impetiginosus TaxID=429701 RepID=A0A2G9HD75_9LAMI|nr:hypothetical protein CDL12_11946 [Handroanthus impetiginosus]